MTLISGLSVALMRPKIRATASSVPTLVQPLPASSSIPETAQVATPRAAAETSTRSRNLITRYYSNLRVPRWRICGAGGGFGFWGVGGGFGGAPGGGGGVPPRPFVGGGGPQEPQTLALTGWGAWAT